MNAARIKLPTASRVQTPAAAVSFCTNRGFTLLELLVAIAVFAVVAMLAYGGLATVLDAREDTAAGAERLRTLQQTMLMLQRDLDQVAVRGIRDEYGDGKPALHGGPDWIEFTRGGWSNPAEQPRSALQRVAYALREQHLIRAHWQVLDRAQDSAPFEAALLPQVRVLRLRFLGDGDEWQESWPPLEQGDQPAGEVPLPRAVEMTLELEQWGTLTRLFRVRQ
jgi:general secretion pathway protein J